MIEKIEARKNLHQTKEEFALHLTSIRKEKNVSLKELSEAIYVDSRVIEKIELGDNRLNIGTLHQLSRYFDKKSQIKFVD